MKSYSKVKKRDSNMELLRIIAMLLVMIVHANFRALPCPTVQETNTEVVSSILRFFTESFSIISVNVFVLLSGWYGIKIKFSRLLELLFQIFFFSLLCFIIYVFVIDSNNSVGINEFGSLLMLKSSNYWFVKAYLGLYILSPVLNTFVEFASRKQYQILLILFYTFQTIYAWISPYGALYFEGGYSAISFVGLYLLARYVHLYPIRIWRLSRYWDLCIYLLIVIFTTVITYMLRKYDISHDRFYLYTSPFVIISALHFLLFFSKISFNSEVVNWISISCFAIYLLHSNSLLADPCYDNIIYTWFSEMSRISFLLHVGVFIMIVFILSILMDKLRIILWNLLCKKNI